MDGGADRTAAPDAAWTPAPASWTTATDENRLRRVTATFRMSRTGHRYRPKRRTARGAPDTAPRGVAPIFYTARFGNVAPFAAAFAAATT